MLDVAHYSGSLGLEARGGDGGNTADTDNKTGPGGYGGAGVIWHNQNKFPEGITCDVSNGLPGMHVPSLTYYGTTTSSSGSGSVEKKLTLPMNSMLFNFLTDEFILNCGEAISAITSSSPKGGVGVYKFLWEVSVDSIRWDTAMGKYQKEEYYPWPSLSSAFYRRIVSSAGFIDTSKIIAFEFYPGLENNLISGDQEICLGDKIEAIIQSGPPISGGTGSYNYTWEYRSLTDAWTKDETALDSPDYQPDNPGSATQYRRVVYSGSCFDISNLVIIDVIYPPQITLQPADHELMAGATVRFTVEAESDEPLSYHWIHQTGLMAPDSNVFTIENVSSEHEGFFYCVVKSIQCESVSDTAFLKLIEDPSTFIDPYGQIREIIIFPNPARNELNLIYPFKDEFTVRIYNMCGQIQMEYINRKNLDISHLEPGQYIIRVSNTDHSHNFIQKILIYR